MILREKKGGFAPPTRFVDHPELRRTSATRILLRQAEAALHTSASDKVIDESTLFRAMNACGKELSRKKSSGQIRSEKDRERIRALQRRIVEFIVERNVGLVYDMLKRTRVAGIDRDELVSEGMWTLFKAATSFDPWRGFKFSTYACTSILRAYFSLARKRNRDNRAMSVLRERFELLETRTDRAVDLDIQVATDQLGRVLSRNAAKLTDLERFVIERRVLHDPGSKAETLSQIGEMVDLSKERVRQVQLAALAKLSQAMEQEVDMDESLAN